MNEDRFLKPIKGLLVRDPVTFAPLSEEGEYKPWGGRSGVYWRRRVNEGTVIICSPMNKKTFKEEEKKVKEDMEFFSQKKSTKEGEDR